MILIALTLILLLIFVGLLIPVGRYARKVGLVPRYWIMVNMVAWAACWVLFKWIWVPIYGEYFIRTSTDHRIHHLLIVGMGITIFFCLLSYGIIWFIIRKRGNRNLQNRIDQIGKQD